MQFGLLPLALQDADTTRSVQHNQPDVLFYPPSLCGHTQLSGAGSTAVKVHPSPRINPPAPQIITILALLNLRDTTTSSAQNENNMLSPGTEDTHLAS